MSINLCTVKNCCFWVYGYCGIRNKHAVSMFGLYTGELLNGQNSLALKSTLDQFLQFFMPLGCQKYPCTTVGSFGLL